MNFDVLYEMWELCLKEMECNLLFRNQCIAIRNDLIKKYSSFGVKAKEDTPIVAIACSFMMGCLICGRKTLM